MVISRIPWAIRVFSRMVSLKNARKNILPSFSDALSFASGDFFGGSTTLSASFSNHKSSILELSKLQNG